MEQLFTTHIKLKEQDIQYRVVFEREQYDFIPQQKGFPSFSFQRVHDEWHGQADLPPAIKNQAIEALEKYLMKQH